MVISTNLNELSISGIQLIIELKHVYYYSCTWSDKAPMFSKSILNVDLWYMSKSSIRF